MTSILLLPGFFSLGFLLRIRMGKELRKSTAILLNRFVVYLALPALVLVYLPGVETDPDLLLPALSAWGAFILSAIFVLLVSRIVGWNRQITGALLFTVPLGNTSFLGVPFTLAFYGQEGLPYTLVYDQLGSFLILSTIGIFLLSYYSGTKFHFKDAFFRMLRFPAFIALFVALLLGEDGLPEYLKTPAEWLAASLSPMAMIAVGLQIRLRFPRSERIPFYTALLFKLLIAPIVMLTLFIIAGLEGTAAKVTVFESAMAPMVSSSTLAILAGLEAGFVASVLGYGILLSFLTVPAIHLLIEKIL